MVWESCVGHILKILMIVILILFIMSLSKIKYNNVININTKEGKVIMMSEEDYNSLMESLYLSGIPGMYESIVEEANIKLENCDKIEWK